MRKSRVFRKGWIVAAALVLAILLFVVSGNWFRSEASIPDDQLISVSRGDLARVVVATGAIEPVSTVEVKSKASGLVKQIFVDAGDPVREGQILMELDKELLNAQLREAEANLKGAEARLQQAEAEVDSAVTMKQKLYKDLENLENKVSFLRRQVERFETLFSEKLISHSDLEVRERELHEAEFQAEALRSEVLIQDSAIESARKVVGRQQAEVLQTQAVVDRSLENLRNATIQSPIEGIVLKRNVEVGDAVSSILQLGSQATLLLSLGDLREVYFEGRVDETDIGQVFVGQKARVKVDSFREQPFSGTVTRISPLGEEKDNVIGFLARVAIQDPERILRANMSANAEIIIEERFGVLLIPETAVVYDRDRNTFAEVFDRSAESQKRRVPIEVGISNGTQAEVLSGLSEGDQLVKDDSKGLI